MGAGNIMERLDRILINITLLSTFSIGYANILTCSASDHFPITLTLENHRPLGPIPFRYSSLWNDIPAVTGIVYSSWIQHVEISPGFIWETKIWKTKQAIKEWAKTKYQQPEKVKKEIKNNLESIQRAIEDNGNGGFKWSHFWGGVAVGGGTHSKVHVPFVCVYGSKLVFTLITL